MNEDFLHFIWKFSLFSSVDLFTQDGEEIEIVNPGIHNSNAGPDFLDASIRIGNELWLGHVEIHIKASDWFRHNHQEDDAYQNVILHIVLEDDKQVNLKVAGDLPVFEMAKYIRLEYFKKYELLSKSKSRIPCANQIHRISDFVWFNYLERLVIERLERKSKLVHSVFENCQNDWNEAFYRVIAGNFGFKVNSEAFQMLAESLPLKIIAKHRDSLFQIEALLYGQAGMLTGNLRDKYPLALENEYEFLKQKYSLRPLRKSIWKNLRLMPNNFPHIRIAQFAHLLFNSRTLFSKIIELEKSKSLKELFRVHASSYWDTHSGFEKPSRKRVKRLGESSIENILVNTVVPFLFVYGRFKQKQSQIDRGLGLLESCRKENNSVTRAWKKIDVKMDNALHSQASLELKNEYCTKKKCLSCVIGIQLLKGK